MVKCYWHEVWGIRRVSLTQCHVRTPYPTLEYLELAETENSPSRYGACNYSIEPQYGPSVVCQILKALTVEGVF